MPHIHEKIDFTVEVFVVFEDKVLLRKHDKYGIWLSVGGHVELDEDPTEAAKREVKEEVGLDIELLDTREFKGEDKTKNRRELMAPVGMNRHSITDTHEHVCLIYFAKALTDDVIPETENDEWKWCKEDEIESLDGIGNDIVYYAKRALREVNNSRVFL